MGQGFDEGFLLAQGLAAGEIPCLAAHMDDGHLRLVQGVA